MLIQQGTAPVITVVNSIPIITAGTPSYSVATSYHVRVNATDAVGGGTTSNVGPGIVGPGWAVLGTVVGDWPTIGPFQIQVRNAGGEVIGSINGMVVNFDPYQP